MILIDIMQVYNYIIYTSVIHVKNRINLFS
jgi:hypothetical protein